MGDTIVCERCGTVLGPDDRECPGCGKPYRPPDYEAVKYELPKSPPPRPYPPTRAPKQSTRPTGGTAKCARCGAIVYDYETRCSNCGRILSPPTPQRPTGKRPVSPPPPAAAAAPPGTARCGRCNAVVYPHQTVCPNCGKPLAPVTGYEPSGQRMARCRRCGHVVYPTDSICPNCGRRLDPA